MLSQNLSRYRELYPREELEIIIVDDGSPDPAVIEGEFPWRVEVIRLPAKDVALNPCVPFNVGVNAARGEYIALTNPEVVHRSAVLMPMLEQLTEAGDTAYVAAACWNDPTKLWYCHSVLSPPSQTMGRERIPFGAGFHFLALLHRSLYDRIGGFSQEYRDGQGYEDNDLLWKLYEADAQFIIMDECVTDHVECVRSNWIKGGAERNKEIFVRKWQHLISRG